MMMRPLPALFSRSIAFFTLASCASAATLVDFKPAPVSPTSPEFSFGAGPVPSFSDAAGASGNGDGELPEAAQSSPGLLVETPFIIGGIPGSLVKASSTDFYDVSLVMTGLFASGPATSAGGLFTQPLGPGAFSFLSTDPIGPGGPTLLLSGTIDTSSFIVGTGNAASEFNAFGVTYTGGVILPFLLNVGGSASGNSMSISRTDVSPNLSINGQTGFLNDFTANGTGLFNFVPEPASLAVLAMGGMLAVRRRTR